ncbi:hypothetical protein K4F52_003343 [Lecanicillium sp. MT-2017a]|nr:hypothetical protein K4F52_003343 [Lecanicillium sp. MT-2017a]
MQHFIPSLVKAFGWQGAQAQYYTIPGYMFAVVCILTFCFAADYFKKKAVVLIIVSAAGTILFIAVTTATANMARSDPMQDVIAIFVFGIIYGCSPIVKTWGAEVVRYPAEKRAIAIALINSLGNASSIYGSWLWPDRDGPSVTTAWMGAICLSEALFAYLFAKYSIESPEAVDVIASEIRQARQTKKNSSNV